MAVARGAERAAGRWLAAAARGLALAGGLVVLAMALLTVASVAGRALVPLGLAPVRGDFELVAMGCAVAVFAFLPWCQVRRGHAAVDILTARLPPRGQAVFGLIGDAVMSVVAGVILWRLWLAFGERFPHGPDPWRAALGFGARPVFVETSAELGVPVWIPYLGALAGAALFALVCLHGLWRALNALLDGPDAGPAAAGGAA